MPLTMQLEMIGLGPKIGGSAASPHASANVLVKNIDEAYNLDDVTKKVIEFVAPSVQFTVPNMTGTSLYEYTLLYLTSVDPEFIGDGMAVAAVEWGLVRSTPLTVPLEGSTTGETKKPSEQSSSEVCGPEYTFSTRGGTKHITQSVRTRNRMIVGGGNDSAPSMNRAIGVSKDRVEGCDIATGDMNWSVKVKGVPVTQAYIDTCTALTGTINSVDWYGREAQELLFLGADFSYKAGDAWEVTYSFHQKKNQTAVEICTGITFPVVKGHDYIWVTYKDDVSGGKTIQTPDAAYCEQVYEEGYFDDLGI